jgi:hypothetical protein
MSVTRRTTDVALRFAVPIKHRPYNGQFPYRLHKLFIVPEFILNQKIPNRPASKGLRKKTLS